MTALADVLGKLRNKKQAAHRSAFGHYIEAVRKLASGAEIDADECSHILESADRDETALERDVGIQQQRNARAAQLQANQQAVADQIVAERDLAAALRKLQAEIDRLQPVVDQARQRLDDANRRQMGTHGAESWLAENVLDLEIQQRESAVVAKLRPVVDELRPLLKDREPKRQSLENAQFNLGRLSARKEGDWLPAGLAEYFHQPADIRALGKRVADLKSQMAQLDAAIAPRQAEQARLQNELSQIHQEKLKP